MKQRILSAALALCLCISSRSLVYAGQEDLLLQKEIFTKESTSVLSARDSTIPTPTEVYTAMIALKDDDRYKEGTTWTNDEPYSDKTGYYRWKGGTLDGKIIVAAGCVAFAFVLSDTAFGNLPARMYAAGKFTFEKIKAGDILRVNNDTHTVIVLEVSDAGVVIAEGNYGGKTHWGRAMSKEEVMSGTSHYITRYPEGYVPPDDPGANETVASGTLDGGIDWKLIKAGTLTISGKGAMPSDFSGPSDQPWNDYSSQIRKVVIGDGITGIGSSAFWGCRVLSAEIPGSVTTIGRYAFYQSSLISVTIPSGVKNVGDSAFRECQNLCSVKFFEGVETIDQNAFRACTSLTAVALPASIEKVGAGAFFECTEMTCVAFAPGSKQVKLGDNMFTRCYYLRSVTLPQSVDCIGEGMFQNCGKLTGVEIPQGAESIGGSAFASSGVSAVIIPDSVKTIGIAAFSACPLTDIYFTGTEAQWNSIRKIGDTVSVVSKATRHYNCTPAVSPDPDDGDDNDNNSGENSESSDNSENADNSESGGNSESSESQVPEQTPFKKGKTFTIGKITYKVTKAGEEVELTTSKSTAAKVAINTVTGTDGVKYKVTSIGTKAMQNNKKMKSLTVGDQVKKIGTNAFSGCTKLATVTFGKNVVTIGKSAFSGCRKLNNVTIQSTRLNSVGKQAFKGTISSLKVKVPSKKLTKYKKILKKAGLKDKQIKK